MYQVTDWHHFFLTPRKTLLRTPVVICVVFENRSGEWVWVSEVGSVCFSVSLYASLLGPSSHIIRGERGKTSFHLRHGCYWRQDRGWRGAGNNRGPSRAYMTGRCGLKTKEGKRKRKRKLCVCVCVCVLAVLFLFWHFFRYIRYI